MNRFGIALVALIGIGFLLGAADVVRKAAQDPGGVRWGRVVGGLLMIYGGAAFFVQGLASVGGLGFLGPSFEWPVGVPDIVAADSQGRKVVALSTCGRVQVYSADGRFLNGWFVDASGGEFKIRVGKDDSVEVFTARGHKRLLFSNAGTLLERSSYRGDYSAVEEAPSVPASFRTPVFLWPFAHPFAGWAMVAVGMVALALTGQAGAGMPPNK